jgi:molybdopterin-guanine dinucleotide biosynthesis protein A
MNLIHDVTGVLLAGGQSTRMGRDKRFLPLGGRTLLARALSVLENLFAEVLLSVAAPMPELAGLRHRVVADVLSGCATLGGLYSALLAAGTSRIFAAACDMPFLNPAVIRHMVNRDPQADLVIARLANGLHPMHAVYSKGCAPHLAEMAKQGNLKVQDLASRPGLAVTVIPEDELSPIDARLLSFMNINTPADLELARKLLQGEHKRSGGHS